MDALQTPRCCRLWLASEAYSGRDDDFVARFEPRGNGVAVAHRIAQRDRRLDGKRMPILLLRHKHETLPTLARYGEHRNHRHWLDAPDDPRIDHLRIAQNLWRGMNRSFYKNALQRAVHLG